MKNNNYPNMFDEKIVNEEFLDSLHSIAKEPLSERIASSIKPVRLGGVVILLLLYGNTMFESISKIYWHYYAQLTTKLINIEIASSYGVGLVEFIFSNATFFN
jgi:hypothetical protein